MDLDHIGILVPDIDESRSLLRRCGFLLTAPELLMSGEGSEERWAGGVNTVSMFDGGYMEVQEIRDPGRGHPLADRATHRGVHVLAFGTPAAAAERKRLVEAGYRIPELTRWSRKVEWGSYSARAEFRFFPIPAEDAPSAAYTLAIEHLTPAAVRPPGITAQPNGVTALTSVVECSPDPERIAIRYAEILNGHVRSTRNGFSIDLDRGGIDVVDPTVSAERYGHTPLVPGEVVALRFGVRDLATIAEAARYAGLEVEAGRGSILVKARQALGVDFEVGVAA